MGAKAVQNDPIQNFCSKIKERFKKEGEENSHDFTIKDKDGAEVKSHKFLLASQSEYFASLLRMNPTTSETTLQDFALDVIKKCIDFLYIHEINLIDCSVQHVLVFANYINLTDVTDICTDFISKNLDNSNCGHVINLGKVHGMDRLVEAGVFFAVRNRKQSFDNLDEFTKEMISKFADKQKQQVTIMTGNQWNVNYLSAPMQENVFQARGSSIFIWASNYMGPNLAINGEIAISDTHFYHSEHEKHPWLEVKLPSPVLISSVTIVNRQDGCRERLRSLEVRAGMEPVPEGFTVLDKGYDDDKKLEVNSRYGYFAGPADRSTLEEHVIVFDKPTLPQYITLQILAKEFLQNNGIRINGGDSLNYHGYF